MKTTVSPEEPENTLTIHVQKQTACRGRVARETGIALLLGAELQSIAHQDISGVDEVGRPPEVRTCQHG